MTPGRRPRAVVALALVGLACLAGACARTAGSRSAEREVVMSGLSTPLGCEIKALDVARDASGETHLVWEQLNLHADGPVWGEYSIWYRRGNRDLTSWTEPVQISDEDTPPRLVLEGKNVHVLVGRYLRHFLSTDGGSSWKELTQLIPKDDSIRCLAFKYDAVFVESTLVVSYLGYPPGLQRWRDPEAVELEVARVPPDGRVVRRTVGRFPMALGDQAVPRLIRTSHDLALVCTANADRSTRETQSDGTVLVKGRQLGDLMLFRSADQGVSWTSPKRLPDVPGGSGPWRQIYEFHGLATQPDPLVLFNSVGSLHAVALTDTGWTVPHWIRGPNVAYMNSMDSRTFDCLLDGRKARIAWVSRAQRPFPRNLNIFDSQTFTKLCALDLPVDGGSLASSEPRTFPDSSRALDTVRLVPTSRGTAMFWAGIGFKRPLADIGNGDLGAGIAYRELIGN